MVVYDDDEDPAATSLAHTRVSFTMTGSINTGILDALEGRAQLPGALATLGFELIEVDTEAGSLEAAFTATDQFLNSFGTVQGGLVAAMLDAALGLALVVTLEPGQGAPTTDLHVQFLRPSRTGRLVGRGRVVKRGREVAFLAGELIDENGTLVATATATAHLRRPDHS
jgi:uncharacterized protein (TIGR00369 family)